MKIMLSSPFEPSSPNKLKCLKLAHLERQGKPVAISTAIKDGRYLQGVLQKLVHLCQLGTDAEVNGTVANFDNQASTDVWVDLGDNLELLALADVLRLADGVLELADDLGVKGLFDGTN